MSGRDPWDTARVIPYDSPTQAYQVGEYMGVAMAVERLKELPEIVRKTPGFITALATLEAATGLARSNMAILSLKFAAKNGVDIQSHQVASYPDGLRVLPLDLAELAES